MNQPIPFEVLETELDAYATAWILQEKQSGNYLLIPHDKYPGRRILHFFLSQGDAEKVLMEVNEANPDLSKRLIMAVEIELFPLLRRIAANQLDGVADGFVVHSPNEVLDFVRERE